MQKYLGLVTTPGCGVTPVECAVSGLGVDVILQKVFQQRSSPLLSNIHLKTEKSYLNVDGFLQVGYNFLNLSQYVLLRVVLT